MRREYQKSAAIVAAPLCTNTSNDQAYRQRFPMSFLLLKYLHILCVATTFALFFIRGLWTLRGYPEPQENWVRALPYVIDGVLILAAIMMITLAPRWEWSGWVQIKLGMIVAYAILVLVVFQEGRPRWQKALAWSLGLLLFLMITSIAVLKRPGGIFSLL